MARFSTPAIVALALAVAFACSSKVADGESCEDATDCESGRCTAGACEGADCTCEGSDCRTRSSCREGWLCARLDATTQGAIPQCFRQCDGAGSCSADKHCENGLCRPGPEKFSLSWVNLPRRSPCAPRVPCTYEVKPSSQVTIAAYTWTFGDAPPIETTEPTTAFTYAAGGTYAVLVSARASTGAVSELRATEVLCVGALGAPCDPGGSSCCQGTCSAQLICR